MADRMVFFRTSLIDGAAGSLDSIDGADRGDGNPLQDGDIAFTIDTGVLYCHLLDDDSAAAESSPTTIRPDTNAGDKRWIQQSIPTAFVITDYLAIADIDDTPVNGETAAPISSNWAYDHAALKTAHGLVEGTAEWDFLSAGASPFAWAKKTLAEVKGALHPAPGAIGETTPDTIRGKNKEIYKTASADSPLTVAQCSGTIVSNYGMTDADCVIDLPTAAEGLAFVCILPAVRARYFRLKCPTADADKIYLSGVAGTDDGYVGVASGYATGASISLFTFKASDGGFDWMAIPLFGTWVAG